MREQEQKLSNVKKSCDTARKVSKVLAIFMMVVTALCLISMIIILAFKEDINRSVNFEYKNGQFVGKVVDGDQAGILEIDDMASIVNNGVFVIKVDTEKMLTEGKFAELIILQVASAFILGVCTTAIFIMIQKTFELIIRSETPFDIMVMKRLKVVFVIISIAALLISGLGAAIMCSVVCWCIYCILDYGYALQKEVDEIL